MESQPGLTQAREELRPVAWRGVVKPFVVSRLLSDSLIVLSAVAGGRTVLWRGFRAWDGRWYTWIAAHGYTALPHAHHRQTPWPFFPLLPFAMRAVSSVSVSIPLAGIVVSHVAFFVALVGVQRIAVRHTSRRGACLAVWITALSPFAFVFSMIYPSALFLAASVWAFLLVEEGRDLAAGVVAAAAALARPNGVIVAIVLIFVVRFAWPRLVRVAGPALVGLSAWMLYVFARTGDPLRFLHAKSAWREVDLAALVERQVPNALFHLGIAGVAIALVLVGRRALPRAWSWFTVLYLAPSLLLGIVGMGRYATESFPPTLAAGALLARHRRRTIVLVFGVLVVAQAVAVYVYTNHGVLL